ncbi:hypothetical protein DV515_00016471 [Chloebia gouldiae]|uniref:Uncharacterized protein n=1 Tax=Chloebia gouldiae TaxID=44316 RepID=A0A3L8RSI8_CHLGU|nr:hypothetical protein DV515_00016471 [Chloebia gouldiae]
MKSWGGSGGFGWSTKSQSLGGARVVFIGQRRVGAVVFSGSWLVNKDRKSRIQEELEGSSGFLFINDDPKCWCSTGLGGQAKLEMCPQRGAGGRGVPPGRRAVPSASPLWFSAGLIKVLLYMAFMTIMIKVHTFPLFAIRPMYLAMR